MKCPQCGHWNRASFPRCFRCGAPLPQEDSAQDTQEWRKEIDQNFKAKTYLDIDDDGVETPSPDQRDLLASEMKDYRQRKDRGAEQQQRLRLEETQPNRTYSSGRSAQSTTRRRVIFENENEPQQDENGLRPDAIPVQSSRQIDYDGYDQASYYGAYDDTSATGRIRPGDMTTRQMRYTHSFGFHRISRILMIVVLLLGLVAGGYVFIVKPIISNQKASSLQEQAIISVSIYDDLPAHIIRIPAEDGASIYIKELRTSTMAVGGYATFEVPDYEWYKNETELTEPTYNVTISPYLKTSSGEQKPLSVLHFDVDIPLSPLTLISPDVTYMEVNALQQYQVQFKVEKGSEVWINGENYSDLVSTQDGLISYNATVQAIGDNIITLECQTKYYRKNTVVLTLYRKPQDIKLELDPTLSNRWNGDTAEMTISGTTLNKATIRVLSEHKDLDTSQLLTNGRFSFTAVFTKIGTNTVVIEASYPGRETTVVNFDVYHVPSATNYTRRAWEMDAYNYTQFLDHLAARVRNTTIYVCRGTIVDIISTSPQRALMETGTEESSRQVLLDNLSTDVWKVGDQIRVYGDAFGAYNGKPWLIGRYTYPYTPK